MRWLLFLALLAFGGLDARISPGDAYPGHEHRREPADLLANSDFWPARVVLTGDFELPDSPRVLRAGRKGVVMRVEEGHVIVDFGRYGTHPVAVGSTDIVERAERIRSGETTRADLFVDRMFNKFFVRKNGSFIPSAAKDFDGFEYFLLIWADLGSVPSNALISRVQETREELAEGKCRPLLFPLDETERELLADAKAIGWEDPVVYHWSVGPHRRSLALEPISNSTVILIDRNGRVLSRGGGVGFLESLEFPLPSQ